MFFVYILKCNDGSYYVGHTENLEQRILKHSQRSPDVTNYTATRLPVKLVFYQEVESRQRAIEIERQLKGWSRKKKEALIVADYESLKLYSKKCKESSFDTRSKSVTQDERIKATHCDLKNDSQ